MANLKIGFSRPKKFFVPFSWLIRLFDGTEYSHAYIRFYSPRYDRWLVYQASHTVVNFCGPEQFALEADVVKEFDIDLDKDAMDRVVLFAIDNAGLPYDLRSVFGIAIVKIAGVFGKKIPNPLGNGRGFYCSELTGAVIREIDGDEAVPDLSIFTPKDSCEYLEQRQKKNG